MLSRAEQAREQHSEQWNGYHEATRVLLAALYGDDDVARTVESGPGDPQPKRLVGQLPPVVKARANGASAAPDVPRMPSVSCSRTSRKRSHGVAGRIVTLRSLPS